MIDCDTAFTEVMSTRMLMWVACMLILATVVIYRSRDHARWSALAWLPLRGRWLCNSATALLAIPAAVVSLLALVVLVSSITRAVAG